MKIKLFILLFLGLLIIPCIFAINVKVDKEGDNEAMIIGITSPAIFHITLTNLGDYDTFRLYNLVGFRMDPSKSFTINSGESKKIDLLIFPREDLELKGYYTFDYVIRTNSGEEQKEKILLKVVNLGDALEIGSSEIFPESNSITIYIKNKENFDFKDMDAKISSPFFNIDESFPLAPYEKKEFTVNLNYEDFKKLLAGYYTLDAEITVEGKKADIQGAIKFVEKDIVTTATKEYGLFINTNTISKENKGNVVSETSLSVKKNIISRLFTTFSPEPDIVDRKGANIFYTWERQLNPGETFNITVKTNWFFPVLIIVLIVVIIALVRKYSEPDLVLRKKVSFVRSKSGEFALKVSVIVNAKQYIENVNVKERLPSMMNIHERFSGDLPKRVDHRTKTIDWHFDKLDPGETRVISYIIFSKVGVLGKFALPPSYVTYVKNKEHKETQSNRAFFVAEQRTKDLEDY